MNYFQNLFFCSRRLGLAAFAGLFLASPAWAQSPNAPEEGQPTPAEIVSELAPDTAPQDNSEEKKADPPSAAPAVGDVVEAWDKQRLDSADDLIAIQDKMLGVLDKVKPAVVGIELPEAGSGSAVIVSPEGLIMTAGHVSGKPGTKLKVIMPDGKKYDGVALGLNASKDTGMAQINEGQGVDAWPYVNLEAADNCQDRLGRWVFSLGHPGGFDLDRGMVVRLGRQVRLREDFIQSDCQLVGGDSGGPLFSLNGELIGIHSRVTDRWDSNIHVPLISFRGEWDDLVAGKSLGPAGGIGAKGKPAEPATGFLGARVREKDGQLSVKSVVEGSPAAEHLKAEDILKEIDGQPIASRAEFSKLVRNRKPGDTLKFLIERAGEPMELDIELATR